MKNKIFILLPWIIFPLFDTANQIFMKYLGLEIGEIPFGREWLSRALVSPYLWCAFATDVGSFIVWMIILKRANLSFAVPFISVGYITILISGWAIFNEQVYIKQLLSVALIVTGLVMIGSEKVKETKNSEPQL